MVAAVSLLRVLARKTSYQSGEGLTSFNVNKRVNFCGEKTSTIKLSGVFIFRK